MLVRKGIGIAGFCWKIDGRRAVCMVDYFAGTNSASLLRSFGSSHGSRNFAMMDACCMISRKEPPQRNISDSSSNQSMPDRTEQQPGSGNGGGPATGCRGASRWAKARAGGVWGGKPLLFFNPSFRALPVVDHDVHASLITYRRYSYS